MSPVANEICPVPPCMADKVPELVRFFELSVNTGLLALRPETLILFTVKVPVLPASESEKRVLVPSEIEYELPLPMVVV